MSGFSVDDGQGGSYQTDSSGTSGAFSSSPTAAVGMEDEYEDDGPSNDSGGK